MPSATQGPAARAMSSTGTSRRMENSGPSVAEHLLIQGLGTFLPAAEPPVEAAMTSGRGARLSKGLALSGRKPAGRSASASTRCSTPMVSFFPHTGQTPPSAAVSAGVRQTPQFRWPSRWYLPSSGKNSTVPWNPSPVRMAADQLRIGQARVQQVRLPAQLGGGVGVGVGDQRETVQGGDPPVHGRVGGEARLHRVDVRRSGRQSTPPWCQSRRRRRTGRSGASRCGRG